MSKIKKIKFYVMYGQTEASPRMSYLNWKYVKKKIGSIGKPIPGGKFCIYNDKNKIIKKNNAVGELIYEGNNVMLGYAEKIEDLKKKNFNKNKLFTGDFAKRDKDGFYYIIGRKNRYLKMFGLRINLDEVEQQIKSQNIDSACLGKDDNLKVLITNPRKKSFVTNFLTQNLGINKSHLSISIVKKIPKNLDGKILYSNLQNLIT
jgi:acyl-coenzyme A synthetase/AMP-(fatty) acid ligase